MWELSTDNHPCAQKSPDQWDVSLELLEAPIVRHFHQMAAQGNTVTDEKWQELRSLCNLALPGFLESLAATGYYPNLVETQICLLIKLRFLMSEIGTIVQLSSSALSKKRVRMLKKMYGIDGSSSDFDEKIRLLCFRSYWYIVSCMFCQKCQLAFFCCKGQFV